MPEPLAEMGTIRRLGAEVIEYPVGEGHAAAGIRVRELGLPREAVVNVIVRGEEAIPPRGSTRIQAGDRLHVLVRREVSEEIAALMERWRDGPIGPPRRPRRSFRGVSPVFTVRPFDPTALVGDVGSPTEVMGLGVIARIRVRRDAPGALLALDDGRYAITGDPIVVGSRRDLTEYATRRLTKVDEEEASWLRTVIGVLALDAFE
jgi:cell volume regulation protein A